MAHRIVHRAGPYVVRVKRGRAPRKHIDTFYWVEGPGMPDTPPANCHEAACRPLGVTNVVQFAELLAAAYNAGFARDLSRKNK